MRMPLLSALLALFLGALPLPAQSISVSPAINQFGLDLLRAQASAGDRGNSLLSPYSIETALTMTYVGADGRTRDEMQRVLHLPADDTAVLDGFSGLRKELTELQAASQRRADHARKYAEAEEPSNPGGSEDPRELLEARRRRTKAPQLSGGSDVPIEINVANRLFAQSGFALRSSFTAAWQDGFGAPLEELDFLRAAEPSRVAINAWIAKLTRKKIPEPLPLRAIDSGTRLVLANAIYLRATWETQFEPFNTRNDPFWIDGKTPAEVPTMGRLKRIGCERRNGYTALALPYEGGELQFVILLPDERDGLANLERSVTPELLSGCAKLPRCELILHLPKLSFKPPTLELGEMLRNRGMQAAFDQPRGSANFDRMASRMPDNSLCISKVFHQTWLSPDEKGTEAAAATAVEMAPIGMPPENPVEVRVDRPFLFAIQHVPSGTCLFLGRLVDPR